MDHYLTKKMQEEHSQQAAIEAEKAIMEEVKKFKLEYAELSVTIRELLGKVYVRGAIDTITRIKGGMHAQNKDNPG